MEQRIFSSYLLKNTQAKRYISQNKKITFHFLSFLMLGLLETTLAFDLQYFDP